MKIQSIQKVIKVGDSLATTIPAKDAKALGIKAGDNVVTSYEVLPDTPKNYQQADDAEVISAAKKILQDYKEDFEHLAER